MLDILQTRLSNLESANKNVKLAEKHILEDRSFEGLELLYEAKFYLKDHSNEPKEHIELLISHCKTLIQLDIERDVLIKQYEKGKRFSRIYLIIDLSFFALIFLGMLFI